MPDIENRHRSFITNIKSKARETGRDYLYRDTLDVLAAGYGYFANENLVGAGQECVVVTDNKSKPDIVVAFAYKDMDPIEAKRTFYLHRIFSTLFPHNFPRFYASFGGEYSRTVRQRISTQASETPFASPVIQFPFSKVAETVVFQWGLPYSKMIDAAPFNFTVGADGGQYYLDTINTAVTEHLDYQKITDYMDRHNFPPENKEKVKRSFIRLTDLDRMYHGSVCSRLDLIAEHIERHNLCIGPHEYLEIANIAAQQKQERGGVQYTVPYNGRLYRVILSEQIRNNEGNYWIVRSVVKIKKPGSNLFSPREFNENNLYNEGALPMQYRHEPLVPVA